MASMRPRRFRRGKRGIQSHGYSLANRFNEAPAIPPGKTALDLYGSFRRWQASMRPRRFRRGKLLLQRAHESIRLRASMRPRRFRRGKRARSEMIELTSDVLQ